MQKSLGGDAADIEADPPQPVMFFNQTHAEPEICGPEGCGISSGPSPQNKYVINPGITHEQLLIVKYVSNLPD
jgi:hypothetical protein